METDAYREIIFPRGIVGCPNWRTFRLFPEPFEYCGELVSVDQPGVVLVVAEPAWLRIEYRFELDEDDAEALGLRSPEDARVLSVLTIHRDPAAIIANLAGPLVINWNKCIGRQVVLDHQAYPLRLPVLTGAAAQMLVNALHDGTRDETGRADASEITPSQQMGKGA